MTKREKQILEWIKENPMISQEELAKKANITRSSVAVHISNLMKKGHIAGKGYIVQDRPFVTVIGASEIELSGSASGEIIYMETCTGKMSSTIGGSATNIARNLALLGVPVKLITAVGRDIYARSLLDTLSDMGIDPSFSLRSETSFTATSMSIKDSKGETHAALSDFSIYDELTPDFLESRLDVINKSMAVVIDTSIPKESIDFIVENCSRPIFADTASPKKAKKLIGALHGLHTVKTSGPEAEILSSVLINDEEGLSYAAKAMLMGGVKNVFITLGEKGAFAANSDGEITVPPHDSNVKDTAGAGDAFMAGIIYEWTRGADLGSVTRTGLAAASLCVEEEGYISTKMNETTLEERREEI